MNLTLIANRIRFALNSTAGGDGPCCSRDSWEGYASGERLRFCVTDFEPCSHLAMVQNGRHQNQDHFLEIEFWICLNIVGDTIPSHGRMVVRPLSEVFHCHKLDLRHRAPRLEGNFRPQRRRQSVRYWSFTARRSERCAEISRENGGDLIKLHQDPRMEHSYDFNRSELEDDDNNQRKSDVKTGSFQGFDS